jgi:glycosyltransferase involved in cell wall biosynthesis
MGSDSKFIVAVDQVASLRPGVSSGTSDLVRSDLAGKRVGMVVFSSYPADPRPRRAIDALVSQGVLIDLICEGDDNLPKHEDLGKLQVTRVPIKHWRGGFLSYFYQYFTFITISATLFAFRNLRKRYDVIYVHNMPDVLVFAGLIPKLFGAKVILDQHDPMPELMMTIFNREETSFAVRVLKFLEKISLRFASQVITVNVACKRIFSERSCRLDKIGVVMNSPDEKIFQYRAATSYPLRNVDDKPFIIMYHGSLVERNGLDLAVDALARIKDAIPSAELRVYGKKTPYLDDVIAKAKSLGIENNVRFLGPKRLEDLVDEIQACDVGVIPNKRNIFTDINTPTRIFEYLALGKPVIAPNTPGILDYFDEGSLFFFESGNADELAERIQYVHAHPREALDIAVRGQEVYVSHAWREERRTLIDLVGNLIATKK